MKLKDKVAFVTGASSGIGEEVAVAFAREGADVILTEYSTSAEEAAQKIEDMGRKALVTKVNVAKTEDVDRAVEKGIEVFGKIDILFSNAAITGVNPKLCFEMSDEEFEKIINVNLKGCFRCCRAVLPSMLKQRYGRIILVGSVVGIRQGWPTRVHYAASKGGIEGMTRSLAIEVAAYGVTVNCLAPGLVRTPQTLDPQSITEEGLQKAKEEYVPVKFIANPEDIAPFAVLLASKESRYLTGTSILVDGGMMPRSVNPEPPEIPY